MSEINISLKPEVLGTIGDFPITNSLWVSFFVSFVLILFFGIIAKKRKKNPGTIQLFAETFIDGCYKFVQSSTGNKKATALLFPLFATLVAFFLLSNLLGILPFWAAMSINDIPVYRAATADYTLIFVITMLMFITWQVVAVVTGGLWRYAKSYKNPLDIIGELAKIISLSFRLFGNVFAGEVIGTIIVTLLPYIAPIPFAALGMLSSVIQAVVFPILILIFINMATVSEEDIQAEMEKKKKKKEQKLAAAS